MSSGAWVDELRAGRHGYVALPRTPFYLEAGGQVSDSGRLFGADGAEAVVAAHGPLRAGPAAAAPGPRRPAAPSGRRQIVTAEVAGRGTRRDAPQSHRHAPAARGAAAGARHHVKQAGSLVAPDRLRFDFAHFAAIAASRSLEIERIVNEQIRRNTPVQTEVRSTEEAIAAGAMALFGEKYGDRVRVVSVPGFSLELCGGTHVRRPATSATSSITEESGVAAGVRRIEALTGAGAVDGRSSSAPRIESCCSAEHDRRSRRRTRAAAAGRRSSG